jgi:hypothetical protein
MYRGCDVVDGDTYAWTYRWRISIPIPPPWVIFPRKPTPEFHAGSGNVIWAAAHNQFFAMLAMTPTNEPRSRWLRAGHAAAQFQNVAR